MAEPALKEERKEIFDEGLDRGIEKLTPEKIEMVIRDVLDNETGPVSRYMWIPVCIAVFVPKHVIFIFQMTMTRCFPLPERSNRPYGKY